MQHYILTSFSCRGKNKKISEERSISNQRKAVVSSDKIFTTGPSGSSFRAEDLTWRQEKLSVGEGESDQKHNERQSMDHTYLLTRLSLFDKLQL